MWLEGKTIGIPFYSPTEYPPVVYQNSVTGNLSNDSWQVATISPDIPEDVLAVSVVGILIITYGNSDLSEIANFTLRLRRYLGEENSYFPPYIGQVVESRSGGVRSPFHTWVAVSDRKFEYYWTRSTPIPWPNHASYGFNLYIDAYLRT